MEIKKLPVEKRNVPVFNLLPFDRLQDWVIAVDRFTTSGDATLVEELADMDMRPIIKETRGQKADARTIQKLGQQLKTFSDVLATCRSRDILASVTAVKESLQRIQDANMLRPFQPVLRKLEPAIASFQGEEITDGLAATRWCLDHRLYQQGYTILLETMITFVVNQALGKDGRDKDDRNLVNQCSTIIEKKVPESKWLSPAGDDKHKPSAQKVIAWMGPHQDLLRGLRNLGGIRNDLNHAGQKDKPRKAKTIQEELSRHLEEMELIVAKNGQKG